LTTDYNTLVIRRQLFIPVGLAYWGLCRCQHLQDQRY